jgi:hypothetical protein
MIILLELLKKLRDFLGTTIKNKHKIFFGKQIF